MDLSPRVTFVIQADFMHYRNMLYAKKMSFKTYKSGKKDARVVLRRLVVGFNKQRMTERRQKFLGKWGTRHVHAERPTHTLPVRRDESEDTTS